MAVTQYIGSRYVPLFADPIDWDITRAYEPLTIVYYQGNSYTSKQAVPTGIDVTNTTYWAITGNYNAQIEQYRREVQTFDGRITANAQAIADEVTTRMQEDTAIRALITDLQGDFENEVTAREGADTQIRTDFAAADTQIRTDFAAADTQIRTDFAAADTQIRTDFAAADTALSLKNSRMIVFGDSWIAGSTSVPVQNCWIYGVAKGLGGLAIDCYAKGGARMSTSTGNRDSLYSQVQDAIAGISSENRDKYAYAFIMGGVNDFNDNTITPGSFESGVKSAITLLKNNFPNTKIVFIPLNLFYGRYGNTNRYTNFNNSAFVISRDLMITTLYDLASAFRLYGQSVYRPNDDSSYSAGGGTYHPNNEGNNLIANWILQNLHSAQQFCQPIYLTPINGFTINVNMTKSDGQFVYWNLTATSPSSALTRGYHDMAIANWGSYPMVLSDCFGDPNGNEIFARAVPLANTATANNISAVVKDVMTFNPSNNEGQLSIFCDAEVPASTRFILTGVTKIM